MRTWTLFILLAALAAPLAGFGPGYRRQNAAYWYEEAFARFDRLRASMPDDGMQHRLGRVNAFLHDSSRRPTEDLRGFLMRANPALGMARRAAMRDEHDFILDYGAGPDMPLPHLVEFRALARCLAADARVRLHDGDTAGAARHLGIVYRMAEHAGRDRLVRSSLAARSLFTTADRVTRLAIDAGKLGPSDCSALLGALRGLDDEDPFRLVDAVASERRFMIPWYRQRYASEHAGPAGVVRFRREFGPQIVDARSIETLARLTPSQLDADLEAADDVLGQVLAALRLGDSPRVRGELTRLDREVVDGAHGLLASTVLPGFRGLYDRMRRSVETLATRRALLEQLADGRLDRPATANAALWYLRAGAMLERLEAGDRDRLRAFAEDPTQTMDAAMEATLARAEPIIGLLREASWIDRCDFTSARPGHPSGLAAYHASMRDLVRLLHVDAVRCIRGDRFGDAADRLGFALRVTAHLGQDRTLLSARLAQESFDGTWSLIRPGLRAEVFDASERSTLLIAARRMAATDPFGFEESLEIERRALRTWLRRQTPPDAPEVRERVDAVLAGCDASQVFALSLAAGWLEARDASSRDLAGAGGPLEGLVGAEALDAIEDRLPELRDLLGAGRVEDLPGWADVATSRLRWNGRGATQRLRRSLEKLESALAPVERHAQPPAPDAPVIAR